MGKRKETKKAITDIMNADAKDGLYAREHNSPTIQELLDETTPEELEKINKEMKQTAVDFIYDEVWACYSSKLSWSDCEHLNKIKGQAKEMEKQQIETAYQAGDGDAYNLEETKTWAEQYYNDKYGGNK